MLARNLLWKEFHELKWKVAAAQAVTLAIPLSCLLGYPEAVWSWVQTMLFGYPVFAGIFFGGWAAAGERSMHTAPFVAALPLRSVWWGAARLLAAIIAICIPVLSLAILGAAAHPYSEPIFRSHQYHWPMVGATCVVAIHMLVLTAAFGAGRASEVAAALWGLGALALWGWLAGGAAHRPDIAWIQIVRWTMPPYEWLIGITNPQFPSSNRPGPLQFGLVAASLFTLGTIFVLRYARAVEPILERPRKNRQFRGWMPRSAQTQLGALIRKQLRESLPLAGLVFVVASVFAAQAAANAGTDYGIETFSTLISFGGFVLALLLGVGTFLPDLERRVNIFWRSRPLSPHLWYCTKFSVGLAVLFTAVGVPALVASCAVQASGRYAHFPDGEAAWIVLGWIGTFSAAVTVTCLVRRMVYAAILAVGLLAQLLALAYWWEGNFFLLPAEIVLKHLGFFVCATILCILAGWQAAVRDVALLE